MVTACRRAQVEANRVSFINGDAQNLPLPGWLLRRGVDCLGIRNVVDPLAAVKEFFRILRPGGRAIILEFSIPTNPLFGGLYNFYFKQILPRHRHLDQRRQNRRVQISSAERSHLHRPPGHDGDARQGGVCGYRAVSDDVRDMRGLSGVEAAGTTIGHEFDSKKYELASAHQREWGTKLVADLQLQGHERMLDLGCGDGTITREIADLVPDGQVLGIDASKGMIATALAKERKNLRFVLMDINDLAFSAEFDVVFSNATLHWVKDHRRLYQNVANALRDGGPLRFNLAGPETATVPISSASFAKPCP